jgi:hypothetical protein
VESVIDLILMPQRSGFKAEYQISGDVLSIAIDGESENFDFTGLEEGVAGEIITETLPVNPVISVGKTGDIVTVKAIRFYGEDEKEVFESGENQVET